MTAVSDWLQAPRLALGRAASLAQPASPDTRALDLVADRGRETPDETKVTHIFVIHV